MNSGLMRLKNFSPNIYIVCPFVHMDKWTLIIYIGIYKKADYLQMVSKGYDVLQEVFSCSNQNDACYFLSGMGSCLGGLLMNDFNSWWITSDKGLSWVSLNFLRRSFTSSVVLKEMNSDFFCFIYNTMLDKCMLLHHIIYVRLCQTRYD